jgi:hypothetical protein
VAHLTFLGAYADRSEIVTLPKPPNRLCLVHGEEGPMDALRALVTDRFDWQPYMPVHGERMDG